MSRVNYDKFMNGLKECVDALESENFADKRGVALVKTKLDEAKLWFNSCNPDGCN